MIKNDAGDVIINPELSISADLIEEVPGESVFITSDFNYSPDGRVNSVVRQQEDIQLSYPAETMNTILRLRSAAARLLLPEAGKVSFRDIFKDRVKNEPQETADVDRELAEKIAESMEDADLLNVDDADFGDVAAVILSQLERKATDEEIFSGPAGSDAWNIVARMISKRIRGRAMVFNKTAAPTGETHAQEEQVTGKKGEQPERLGHVTMAGRGVIGPIRFACIEDLRANVAANLPDFMRKYPHVFKENPLWDRSPESVTHAITSEIDESMLEYRDGTVGIPGSAVFVVRIPSSADSFQDPMTVEKMDSRANFAITNRRHAERTGNNFDADAHFVLALQVEADDSVLLPGNPSIGMDPLRKARALQNASFMIAWRMVKNAPQEIMSLRDTCPDVKIFDEFMDIHQRLSNGRDNRIKKINLPEGQEQLQELACEAAIGVEIAAAQSSALRCLEYIGAWIEVRPDAKVPRISFIDSEGKERSIAQVNRPFGTDIPMAGKAIREHYFYNTILNIIEDDRTHSMLMQLGWDRRTIPLMFSLIYASPQVQTRNDFMIFMRDVIEFLSSDLVRDYSKQISLLESGRMTQASNDERYAARAMFRTEFDRTTKQPKLRGNPNLNLLDNQMIALHRLVLNHGNDCVMGLAWLHSISNDIRAFRTYTNAQYKGVNVSAAENRLRVVGREHNKMMAPEDEKKPDRRPAVHVAWIRGANVENRRAFMERLEEATSFYSELLSQMPAALNKEIRSHYFMAARQSRPDMNLFTNNVKRMTYMLGIGRGRDRDWSRAALVQELRNLRAVNPENRFLKQLVEWRMEKESEIIKDTEYFAVGTLSVLPGSAKKQTFRPGDVQLSARAVASIRGDFAKLTVEQQDAIIMHILQRFPPQMRYQAEGNPFFLISFDAILRTVRNSIPYMKSMAITKRAQSKEGDSRLFIEFPSGFFKALYAAPRTYGPEAKTVFMRLNPNAPLVDNVLVNFSEEVDEQDLESPWLIKKYRIEEDSHGSCPCSYC